METIEGTIASEWELAGNGLMKIQMVRKKVFPTGKVTSTISTVAVRGGPDLILGQTIRVEGQWVNDVFVGNVKE